jgi:hypothetical protein
MQYPEYLFILLALVPVLLLSYGQYRSRREPQEDRLEASGKQFLRGPREKVVFGRAHDRAAVSVRARPRGFKWEGRIEAVNTRGADVS